MLFAWQAQGFRYIAKYVAGTGVREGCKNVGKRDGFEEGLKRCVMSRKCYSAGIISHGSCRSSYASAQLFRGRHNTFEAST